jgi:hypothetical protein
VLDVVEARGLATRVHVLPATRAIVSWNTSAPVDTLELTVHTLDGRRSRALPYVAFESGQRASLDGFDDVARIETDIVHAAGEIVALDVRSHQPLTRVAASTPPADPPRRSPEPAGDAVRELNVPERSQYVAEFPAERGWCAPASLAMLVGAWGVERTVAEVAAAVYDRGYDGTGNWTFGVALAGACGLVGVAAYLRDLTTIERFVAAGLPLAVSISWERGQLPGAPLERSDGHVLVVRGFDARGNAIVNDPAQPAVRAVYARAEFAACWLAHGGVALLVAPPERSDDLMRCANA